MTPEELVGKKYVFDDGNTIEVIQIKNREPNNEAIPFVTYQIHQGRSLPRKLVLSYPEFVNTFGHLFGLKDPPKS